jgi:hypothetical protein
MELKELRESFENHVNSISMEQFKMELIEAGGNNMTEKLGFCKECGQEIFEKDGLNGKWKGIYECSKCDYPSLLGDLWDELPDYLIGGK